MVKITQAEYFSLRNKFKDLSVSICSQRKKGSNAKTYYCEERRAVLNELSKLRGELVRG